MFLPIIVMILCLVFQKKKNNRRMGVWEGEIGQGITNWELNPH